SFGVGGNHSCALDAEGGAYCWGQNHLGQLGAPSADSCAGSARPYSCSFAPLRLSDRLAFVSLSLGESQSCGIVAGAGSPSGDAPLTVPSAGSMMQPLSKGAGGLGAPTNLSATAASSSRIDLRWQDNASNESGYEIWRSTSGPTGTFTLLALTGANVTGYGDTGLNANTQYCYRVRAYKGGKSPSYSGNSSTTCATTSGSTSPPPPPPPPADPTRLAATAVSSNQIDLSWQDNSTDESGFEIERAPDSGGSPGSWLQIATVAANTTSYADAGLPAATAYHYRVRAYNANGRSGYSNAAQATTLAAALWSSPAKLGQDHPRLAWGDRLYWISTQPGQGSRLYLRTSTNEGATWSDPQDTGITSRDVLKYRSFVAVGSTLYLLTVHRSTQDLWFHKSTNGGATWSSTNLTRTEEQKANRGSIAVNGSYVHVVNSREFNYSNRTVTYWRSTDGGATWAAPVTLGDETGGGMVNPDVATEGSEVHIVYENWAGSTSVYAAGHHLVYRRSTNNGATWAPTYTLRTGSVARGRLVAMGGRVIIAWEDYFDAAANNSDIFLRRSLDGGASWQPVQRVTNEPLKNGHPVLVGGPLGVLHLGIYVADSNVEPSYYMQSRDYGATWGPREVVTSVADFPYGMAVSASYVHMAQIPAEGTVSAYYSRRGLGTSSASSTSASHFAGALGSGRILRPGSDNRADASGLPVPQPRPDGGTTYCWGSSHGAGLGKGDLSGTGPVRRSAPAGMVRDGVSRARSLRKR
ncbi:MAG: fibronectin type III domain-containing protein, partial [Chloroflexi bacterium]|nr:fibronectin type III domain-containing protein [Chloroflexota bacterium]